MAIRLECVENYETIKVIAYLRNHSLMLSFNAEGIACRRYDDVLKVYRRAVMKNASSFILNIELI